MFLHTDFPTTDAPATRKALSQGGFATSLQLGYTHGGPPQASLIQIQTPQTQQHQQRPLILTSRPVANESSFQYLKPNAPLPNLSGPRLPIPILSANINLSPTSTIGSSGAPSSVGHTTTIYKNEGEMEDEPRDFAELPKTSPHFNTHLLLPSSDACQHAELGHEQDRMTKLSFAPIFAPVEIVPYGADRVIFVEGLIWSCVGKIEQLYGPQDTNPPFDPALYGGSIEVLVHTAVLHSLSGESALIPVMNVIQNPPTTHQASDPSDPQPSDLIPLPLFLLEMLRRMRTSPFLLLTAMRWVADLGEKGVIDGVREKMNCAACKSHFHGCRHMPGHLAFLESEPPRSTNRYTRMGRIPPGKKERPSKKKHLQDGKTITLEPQTQQEHQEKKHKVPVIEKIRDGSEDFTAFEGFALAPLSDPKKTVLGALVMAAKWHRDKTVGDKVWGSIVGLTTEEVGRAERALAMGLAWEMGRGWVARSGCGISWVFIGSGGNDDGGEPSKRRKGRRSKKQIDKERLEREEHARGMVLDVLDIQALFPTSDEAEQLRRSDINALVAGSVHSSWSEALCAHGTADRIRYGVHQLWEAGIHPSPIYKSNERPIPVQDTKPRRPGMPEIDWEAMEVLLGLRELPPAMQDASCMQLDVLEAAHSAPNTHSTMSPNRFANTTQPFINAPTPTVGRKTKRTERGEWEDETELMEPQAKKRQLVKQPAFSTGFAPSINANHSAPKTIDPHALQRALKAVPQERHVQLMQTPSDHPSLTSVGSSDAESTPDLVSDDGMNSTVSSRNPSVISVNESTLMGNHAKGMLAVNNHHMMSQVNTWAGERDQVAFSVDAYRLHSRTYPPAPAWTLDASAFTLVQ